MKKLTNLQRHLLTSALHIQAEDLMVFVDNGKVTATPGEANNHFSYSYTANVILVKSTAQLSEIIFVMLEWLYVNEPYAASDIIKFKVDVIDNACVDIHLTVKLTEVVKCHVQPIGTELIASDAPDMNEVSERLNVVKNVTR